MNNIQRKRDLNVVSYSLAKIMFAVYFCVWLYFLLINPWDTSQSVPFLFVIFQDITVFLTVFSVISVSSCSCLKLRSLAEKGSSSFTCHIFFAEVQHLVLFCFVSFYIKQSFFLWKILWISYIYISWEVKSVYTFLKTLKYEPLIFIMEKEPLFYYMALDPKC